MPRSRRSHLVRATGATGRSRLAAGARRTSGSAPGGLHIALHTAIASLWIKTARHGASRQAHRRSRSPCAEAVAGILLVLVLVVGGGLIAATAYQAGLRHGGHHDRRPGHDRPTAPRPSSSRPTGYGWGWHGWGWGPGLRVLRLLRVPDRPLPVLRADARPIFWRRAWLLRRTRWPGRGGLRRLRRPLGVARARHVRPVAPRVPLRRERARAARRAGGPAPAPADRRRRPSGLERADAVGLTGSAARMRPMKTILVVDDEPRIVELARDYLEHAGFAVLTASDGPSALQTARTRHPDLVVLDLGLPGLDGLDVTQQLRGGAATAAMPIVMLTARDDELDKLLGLELGADDYLTKPFSPRELVARVRAVLRRADRPVEAGEIVTGRRRDPRRPADADRGGRPGHRPHPDRVHDPRDPGPPAGSHLHPLAAARRAPRGRVRELRAGDRLAHQEPAPQARARSAPAALRR